MPPGHQSRDDGGINRFGEGEQLGRRPGLDHPAAHVEHRTLGLLDHVEGGADLHRVPRDGGLVAGEVVQMWLAPGGDLVEDVFGDVDKDRTWPSGGGEVERLMNQVRDVVGISHHVRMLGAVHGETGRVRLLEGVAPDR